MDVLVEFEPGHTPGLSVIEIEQELASLCGGHKIDMVNPKYIHPRLKETVLGTARVAYAEE